VEVELFRLLLLIVGVLFLLGIYFWDRHKRINEEIILSRRTVMEKITGASDASKPSSNAQPDSTVHLVEDDDPFAEDPLDTNDVKAPQEYPPVDVDGEDRPAGQENAARGKHTFLGLLTREGKDKAQGRRSLVERKEPSLTPAAIRSAQASAADGGIPTGPDFPEQATDQADPQADRDDAPAQPPTDEGVAARVADRQTAPATDIDERAPQYPEGRNPGASPVEEPEDQPPAPVADTAVDPLPRPQAPYQGAATSARPETARGPTRDDDRDDSAPRQEVKASADVHRTAVGAAMPTATQASMQADRHSGAQLDLKDTEADDLLDEADEDALEATAYAPSASILPPDDEPILAPLPKDLPSKLVQLSVVARGAYMEGTEILDVVRELGLQTSRLHVFHRVDPNSNEVVYSIASMVEPGTFPVEDMSDFATPGVTLFMQLPCSLDGPTAFDDLLYTAKRLAESLNGELQDQRHSVLSRQSIEHTRSEIQEHSRQVQLALRRRSSR
jgi:cell division protein ZipA